MLYPILKTIIDTTIAQYVCQQCQRKVDENCISVGETTDTQIHLDITCPHCHSHAHIHVEVANVETQIIQSATRHHTPLMPKNEHAIQDSDIENIKTSIENAHSIEDLLQ